MNSFRSLVLNSNTDIYCWFKIYSIYIFLMGECLEKAVMT